MAANKPTPISETPAGEGREDRNAAPDPAATAHTEHRYELWASIYDWAEWPAEQFVFRRWREQLWTPVEGPEVLELGVGTGKNIPYYPEAVQVTAIDLAPQMIVRAHERARRYPEASLALREMDAQALEFPTGHFDEVIATMVFCSVPDPVLGLREALRVTKPGGHLRLLEHMRASTPILDRLMDVLDAPIHWLAGMHIARQTVENVRRAGWRIDEVVPLSTADIFRRIVARKPE